MWRSLFIMLAAAALGAFAATVGLSVAMGGTGSAQPAMSVLALSAGLMLFTVPGALLLIAVQALLTDGGISRRWHALLVPLVGAAAGAAIQCVIFPPMAAVAAVYGLSTAVALLLLQRFAAGKE